jgi:hypothetical protein
LLFSTSKRRVIMFNKFMVFFGLVGLLQAGSAFSGENKDDTTAATQPDRHGKAQVVLGAAETAAGVQLLRSSEVVPEIKSFLKARKEVKRVNTYQDPETYNAEAKEIDEAGAQLRAHAEAVSREADRRFMNQYEWDRRVGQYNDQLLAITRKHNALKAEGKVIDADMLVALKEASANVESRSLDLLLNVNRFSKSVKLIGSTLVFADVASRIYTWKATDAAPKVTPVGSYLWNVASNILGLPKDSAGSKKVKGGEKEDFLKAYAASDTKVPSKSDPTVGSAGAESSDVGAAAYAKAAN